MNYLHSACITLLIVSLNLVAAEQPSGEFFLAAPPKGWTLANKNTQLHITDFQFVPANESAKSWKQMVTISKMAGETIAPDQFLIQTAEQHAKQCDGYEIQRLKFTGANGYATHGMIELCGKHKTSGNGELTVVRAIQGQQYLFVMQKAWRLKPFDLSTGFPIAKEEIDDTILYLASTKVCDTRKGTCPASMGNK